jgi:hypothetical protein
MGKRMIHIRGEVRQPKIMGRWIGEPPTAPVPASTVSKPVPANVSSPAVKPHYGSPGVVVRPRRAPAPSPKGASDG